MIFIAPTSSENQGT